MCVCVYVWNVKFANNEEERFQKTVDTAPETGAEARESEEAQHPRPSGDQPRESQQFLLGWDRQPLFHQV